VKWGSQKLTKRITFKNKIMIFKERKISLKKLILDFILTEESFLSQNKQNLYKVLCTINFIIQYQGKRTNNSAECSL